MEPEKKAEIKKILRNIEMLKFYLSEFDKLLINARNQMIDVFDASEFDIKKRLNNDINQLRIELCKQRDE